jgi:hypothetical protein
MKVSYFSGNKVKQHTLSKNGTQADDLSFLKQEITIKIRPSYLIFIFQVAIFGTF